MAINGTNGYLIWERIYDSGYMDGAGFSTSLTVDHADNVFVAGTTNYETGNLDKVGIIIIKYNGVRWYRTESRGVPGISNRQTFRVRLWNVELQ